jgi:hypothetical protein
VWFDDWVIKPGDDVYLTLETGLAKSRVLVLFLSDASLNSEWVGLERSTALFRDPRNTDRRFVPVLLEDARLPDTIRRFRYVDYREDSDVAFRELLAACIDGVPPELPGAEVSIPARTTLSRRRNSNAERGRDPIAPYLALTLGAFVAALIVLSIMLGQAEKLVRLGLAGNLYYIVLLPLGVSLATALFGGMRSYARFTGRPQSGRVELRGPVVVALLVPVLGFVLIRNPTIPFAMTVFVHGSASRNEIVLRNQGAVLLDLGGDRRKEAIGEKGQAYFPGIPANFRGQVVSVLLEAEGYELATSATSMRLDSESAYLAVRPKAFDLVGFVTTVDMRQISGASVTVEDQATSTNASGYFRLTLRRDVAMRELEMHVSAPGFAPWRGRIIPGANPISVLLDKDSK